MDEALKRCVFTSKFEVIEQGADERASDITVGAWVQV